MSGRISRILPSTVTAGLLFCSSFPAFSAKTFYGTGSLTAPSGKGPFQATYQDSLGNWYALVQHTTSNQSVYLEGATANELITPDWHLYVGSGGSDADSDIDSTIARCNAQGEWKTGHMAHNTGVLSGIVGVRTGKRIAVAHNYVCIDGGPSYDQDCGTNEYSVVHN